MSNRKRGAVWSRRAERRPCHLQAIVRGTSTLSHAKALSREGGAERIFTAWDRVRNKFPISIRAAVFVIPAQAGTMLVLSRRKGEQIIIGDSVLTLLDAGRGRVRIGIEAPRAAC